MFAGEDFIVHGKIQHETAPKKWDNVRPMAALIIIRKSGAMKRQCSPSLV
jgi:hypothetical protein